MENSKNNTPVERASGAKSEPCNVPDKETRIRLCEQAEAQVRESILRAEDGFALIDEMLRQMFDFVKRLRPETEKSHDPQSLVPHLLFLGHHPFSARR